MAETLHEGDGQPGFKMEERPDVIGSFDLNRASLIEASAGTGKTYTITYLVLRLLLGTGREGTALEGGPLELGNILIVTFTNAATADLRDRIYRQISYAIRAFENYGRDSSYTDPQKSMQEIMEEMAQRGIPPGKCIRILGRAQRSIDAAPINTIHAFCARAISQMYAFEAREAFSTKFVQDIAYIYEAALKDVIRKMFYTRTDHRDAYILLGDYADPGRLMGLISKYVLRARLSYAKQHKYPYSIYRYEHIDEGLSYEQNFAKIVRKFEEDNAKFREGLQFLFVEFQSEGYDVPGFYEYVDFSEPGDIKPGKRYQVISGKPAKYVKEAKANLKILRMALEADSIDPLIDNIAGLQWKDNMVSGCTNEDKYYGKFSDADKILGFEHQLQDLIRFLIEYRDSKVTLKYTNEMALLMAFMAIERVEQTMESEHIISNDEVIMHLDRALNQIDAKGRELAGMIASQYRIAIIDEFQDTDPVQFNIFRRIYLDGITEGRCYLIGDPKQSIYAFRGSDINSYIKARDMIRSDALYTLGTNYRSTPELIEGVNAIFGRVLNSDNTDPFVCKDIGFSPVGSAKAKSRFRLEEAGAEGRDIYVTEVLLHSVETMSADKPKALNKEAQREMYAKAAAYRICQCLRQGRIYEDGDAAGRAVRPSDIAVLVRSAAENSKIAGELEKFGIPSVYESDSSSVLQEEVPVGHNPRNTELRARPEALGISYLMAAMCYYKNRQAVLRLLGSGLLSLGSAEFLEAVQDSALGKEIVLLEECALEWERHGFLSAFYRYMLAHGGMEKILSSPGGTRLLTNYLHLCELVQSRHGRLRSIAAQYRDFLIDITRPDNDFEQSDTQVRLDSQREQVRVITVHKSKGLEYPLVFLPFLFVNQKRQGGGKDPFEGFTVFHDPATDRRTLDCTGNEDAKLYRDEQERQEQRRLLYVALTRARCANFLFFADHKEATSCPMAELLGMDTDDELREAFGSRPDIFSMGIVALDDDLYAERYEAPGGTAPVKECSSLPKGAIDSSFSISSFTSVVSGQHETQESFPEGNNDDSLPDLYGGEGAEEGEISGPSVFSFPRGTRPGDFLHRLLERLEFWRSGDRDYLEYLSRQALEHVNVSGVDLTRWCTDEQQIVRVLADWLHDITHAVIFREAGRDYRLADLREGDCVPEMKFLLPSTHLDTMDLNKLCIESAGQILDLDARPGIREYIQKLYVNERHIMGFIKGSLDLTLRFEVGGRYRYFVLDYKSTHLGDRYRSYGPDRIRSNIFSYKNRYDIQYMFYSLALCRHLASRLPGFDYDADVGGVVYMYLRGLKAGQDQSGIFHTKISRDIIQRLDRLCRE